MKIFGKSLSIEGVAKMEILHICYSSNVKTHGRYSNSSNCCWSCKSLRLILTLTSGGPGYATTTPALYVMEIFLKELI